MNMVGGSIPGDRIMDGEDISSVIFDWAPEPQPKILTTKPLYKKPDKGVRNKHRLLVFYCNDILYAVRYGCYKFHFNTHTILTKEEYQADPEICGEEGFPLIQSLDCMLCSAGAVPNNPFLPHMGEECFSQHDPPLMYNLCKDPNEAYSMNTSLPANKAVFDEMKLTLDKFLDNMIIGPALLDETTSDVVPCCIPESFPNCSCNYQYEGPIPPPGRVYRGLDGT